MKKKSIKVGFQGVKGAYSEEASLQFFKNQEIELKPINSFDDVFKSIKNGIIQYGVLPIENSLAGMIHQNYDLLLEYNLWICGEQKIRVSHNLMALKNTKIENIKNVYSHPQALMQCKNYLKKNSKFEEIAYFDTAASARFIAEAQDPTFAAIASKVAAKEYDLKILESAIEDNEKNFTRFIVLQKKVEKLDLELSSKQCKTSILFSLKSIPGALHKALSIFAIRDIDLLKIESRPIPGSPWNYLFYLDFAGKHTDESCGNAIKHLTEIADLVKVLGSYKACGIK